jgi:Protein kinase domain/FHA domain
LIHEGLLFESTDGCSRFLVELGDEVVVGRAPPDGPNNVRVSWPTVSRSHVVIACVGECTVKDAGSAGGAFVDGRRLSGVVPIGPGQSLKLTSDAVYTTRAFRGASLAEVLGSGPMPAQRVGVMVCDLLTTLRPLHEANRAHAAITREEILMEENGAFTLLLRGWSTVDASGAVLGNPMVVAPELLVVDGIRKADATTDVYSIACIAYEALTGHAPFPTETVQATMIAKLEGRVPPLDASWPDVLRDWMKRALADGRQERPTTAESIAMLSRVPMHADLVSAAHVEVCAELNAVASKWAGIREAYRTHSGDDYDWAKGNGRWAVGTAHEVSQLHARTFPSVGALLDAVDGFVRERSWDGDYDEPKHAREEMLGVVRSLRARLRA